MDKEKIKIERGITDLNNIFKHLEEKEKLERKTEWLKNRRKDSDD